MALIDPGRDGPIRVTVPGEGWASVVRNLFPEGVLEVIVGAGERASLPGRRSVQVRRDGNAFRVRPGPGMSAPERGSAAEEAGGPTIPDSPEGVRLDGAGEAVSVLERLIAETLLRDRSHHVGLHAAGALVHGVGVVALGASGAGKSSLALSLSRDGWPLLGDDVVLIDRQGGARPFPRLVKVDVERLAAHGIRPEETIAWVPGWSEAWLDPREGGGWCAGPCHVGLVAILDRIEGRPEAEVRSSEVGGAEALSELLAGALPGGLEGGDRVDALLGLLDGARGLRLSFVSSRDAARFLARECRSRAMAGKEGAGR